MVEIDFISESKVKHDGIFDFKEIYRFLYTAFIDKLYDLEEIAYSEKNTATGKEIDFHWVASRKISDYFRFKIKVDWLILAMTSVEVMKEGIKTKMNKGSLEIKFSCFLEKDYESRWEGTAFLKFLRGLYDNYVIKSRILDYERRLLMEMNEFADQAKAFLVLEAKR